MGTGENRRVDEKGRVTLPQSIRESLGIEAGEEMTVELDDERVLTNQLADSDAPVERFLGLEGVTVADPVV